MPCYSPIYAYRSKWQNENGKYPMVFNIKDAQDDQQTPLACNQCIGCRLERSRQWAIRCLHESKLYKHNSFLTLTFNDEELNKRKNPQSLDKSELQKFMKRLRFKYKPKIIRYYACGEYGDHTGRPHYHLCLFNHDFRDKRVWKKTQGNLLYTSQELQQLWPYGYSVIGNVTFESAAYIARYIMKKVNGEKQFSHYNQINPETGEITHSIEPEFTTMSLKPGIGAGYYEKYKNDIYPSDEVIIKGKKMKPPKYYDTILERYQPQEYEYIKEQRAIAVQNMPFDSSQERLSIKAEIAQNRLNRDYPRLHDKN